MVFKKTKTKTKTLQNLAFPLPKIPYPASLQFFSNLYYHLIYHFFFLVLFIVLSSLQY